MESPDWRRFSFSLCLGGSEVTHGYKGKGTLLHLPVDAKGSCLTMSSTGASGNERKELLELIKRAKGLTGEQEMIVVEAGKGHDSAELRQELLQRNSPLDSVEKECEGSSHNKRSGDRIWVKANPMGSGKNAFLD